MHILEQIIASVLVLGTMILIAYSLIKNGKDVVDDDETIIPRFIGKGQMLVGGLMIFFVFLALLSILFK